MDNLYMLADDVILQRIGEKLRQNRLKQNITQRSLSEASGVPLSTLKRIEAGEIGSFESFLRIVRVLGLLDSLQSLTEVDELTPQEYYEWVNSAQKKKRQRAVGTLPNTQMEDSAW